jgi:glycosyltransferase involved in cell wall biosynthesis
MQRIKVLWFTNTPCSAVDKFGWNLNSGGWLRSLEHELQKVQEITLAISFYSYEKLDPFIYNGTQFYPIFRKGKNSKFHRFITRVCFSRNSDRSEIKELLKVIELFQPNLIHVHGTEDNFGLVQNLTKIPVVISIQGLLCSYTEKYFSGIPYSFASRCESILNKITYSGIKQNFIQFKKYAERERKMLTNAHYIIGRTDWDSRITRILAPQSIYYVGNEILRSAFYTNIWNKKQFDDVIKIVTITGDALYKGFETIVSTAQFLKGNTNLKFVWQVIGFNEANNIVKIVKKWKNVNFGDLNIQFLGVQNEVAIIKILLDSDIYCQTSHIENSPNSLCEAMLLGMPIIASHAGGTDSILENNEEGIIVQEGDCCINAGAIMELKGDFRKAQKMGKAARHRALERHNHSKILNALMEIYNSLLISKVS